MSFLKSKIEIVYHNGDREEIPCFKLLAPFVVDKRKQQQEADIQSIVIVDISNEEYRKLLHIEEPPVGTDDLFRLFWDSE